MRHTTKEPRKHGAFETQRRCSILLDGCHRLGLGVGVDRGALGRLHIGTRRHRVRLGVLVCLCLCIAACAASGELAIIAIAIATIASLALMMRATKAESCSEKTLRSGRGSRPHEYMVAKRSALVLLSRDNRRCSSRPSSVAPSRLFATTCKRSQRPRGGTLGPPFHTECSRRDRGGIVAGSRKGDAWHAGRFRRTRVPWIKFG